MLVYYIDTGKLWWMERLGGLTRIHCTYNVTSFTTYKPFELGPACFFMYETIPSIGKQQ